jgi:hypothetical protein
MFRKNDDVWHSPVAGKFEWGDIETQIDFDHLKYFIYQCRKLGFNDGLADLNNDAFLSDTFR